MLLVALGSLGLMIAGLAVKSSWAPVAGIAFVVALIASVEGFRNGAAKLAEARAAAGSEHHMSIWSKPVQQDQIERYNATYRATTRSAESETPAQDDDSEHPVAA